MILPVASKKYRLIAPLSPLTKRGVVDGARLVKLVANRRLVVSIKRSRAIYSGVLSTASHLPSGHASVAMRSFAQVEHPHLRQRPVALSACASHSGHALHVASRVASASGGVVAHLAEINFANADPAFTHLNVFSLCIYGVKNSVRVALALAP